MRASTELLVTCEHGGNRVPARFRACFAGAQRVLDSHRGWDPGALLLARRLASMLEAPLVHATVTRLLVDLNRSPGRRGLFSEFSRRLGAADRKAAVERFYLPYRSRVVRFIEDAARRGNRVLHLSVHSFTPRLRGVVRRADVGLLYDPARPAEREFCIRLQHRLRHRAPDLAIRRNYPYRGTADGLTTWLRAQFGDSVYAGVELEVNQKHAARPARQWSHLRRLLVEEISGRPGR